MANIPNFPLPNLAPQPVNGHLPIEPWLQQRFVSQFDHDAATPLEYSLYGAVNALLSTQFPLHRKFLVKPQGGLRKNAVNAFEDAPQEPNTSGGTSSNSLPILADFIVVRANEQLCLDWILCIVEVKRQGVRRRSAEIQLASYLDLAAKQRLTIGIIYGFLVIGSECFAYRFNTTAPNADLEYATTFELGATHGPAFKQALFRIARKFWAEQNNNWRNVNFVGPFEV